jgi:AcrR family transcriptional regulator
MATQTERKAETRRKLIKAAKRLFDKEGFDAVSVDKIVKAANVAKGTFYQYYETKIDILADLTRDEGAEKVKEALKAVVNGASALETLERFIAFQCQWFESNEKVAEALIMDSLQTVGHDIKEKNRHSRYFMTQLMIHAQKQGAIREDLDPKEIAKAIGGALVISVLAWCKQPVPGALHTSMKQTLDIVLNGAKTGT